ncbi:MAG: hypothetical protein WBQ59_23085 [Candidatus Acidiferrum sp.]
MAAKDHHIALRTDVLDKINAGYIEIVLAKLQWGKDDVAFTLHVNPSAFTSGPEDRLAPIFGVQGEHAMPVFECAPMLQQGSTGRVRSPAICHGI